MREAYLSGAPAFVVSAKLNQIFWVNGSGAQFLGTPLIGDLISAPSRFDRATISQIEAGQTSQRPVQLRGAEGRCSFNILPVDFDGEEAWLAASTPSQFSRYGRLSLIAGLSGEGAESAIVNQKGELLFSSSGYDLAPERIQLQLENLAVGQTVQAEIIEDNVRHVYGAAKLDDEHLLVISSKKQPDLPPPHSNLNNEERNAFREIAERLKNEMNAQLPYESSVPEEKKSSPIPASLQDLTALLDLATDGVIFLDRDLTVNSITRSAEGLLPGHNPMLVGKLLTASLTPESVGRLIAYRADVDRHAFLNKGCVVDFELDGQRRTISITLIRLETGGYAAILHENGCGQRRIIEPNASNAPNTPSVVESSLEDKAPTKTENKEPKDWPLLAGVAHEIRTPLNAIIGFAELMRDEKFGPIDNQRYREYLRDMVQSGHHVLSLINDLLAKSKREGEEEWFSPSAEIEEIFQPVVLKPVALGAVVREIVSLMQEQANRDGIIVRISLETRLPDILADERAVRQIILNLLSNAIRFTPKGGQIVLSALREGTRVILRIRDTGIGMSMQEIARAMRPYEQIRPEYLRHDNAVFAGTGLGLPLTKTLTEENGATFNLTSGEGVGTVVEICFLRADQPNE